MKPEVVSAVTIRLHKPPDSTTIGLSQILLNGHTAFGSESGRNSIPSSSSSSGADDALLARTRYNIHLMSLEIDLCGNIYEIKFVVL